MGATNIHYEVPKEKYDSPKAAYRALVDEAYYMYGHDSCNGTITTCNYKGKMTTPENQDEYDRVLEYKIGNSECMHYETEKHYVFVGWART